MENGCCMLGIVFSVICIISFIWSLFAGTTPEISAAVLDGAGRAVRVTLSLIGAMSLWNGVMEVLREAGAITRLSALLSPLMKLIFPETSRTKKGLDSAVACIAANLLGIGNAATPLAISALNEMQSSQSEPERASDDAVTLTVLNTASFSVIPTTVLALRRAAGASVMFALLPKIWLCGLIGTLTALVSSKLVCRAFRR